jgi:AcrR family transcriptional regulator
VSSTDLPPVPRLPTRAPARKQRAPRERSLTREAIATAALEIVDSEGLDAMTMRRVAEKLGTGAASLYAHVASKEDLLELVVDRVIGEVEIPGESDPEHWQQELKQGLRDIRAAIVAHGDVARAIFARIPFGENALAGAEWMIRTMRAGGLPDQVIAYACDLLPLYVTAVAYEEGLYAGENITPEVMLDFNANMREYYGSVPPERFPNVVALAANLTAGTGDERFEFGLEVLVRGLAAMGDWE